MPFHGITQKIIPPGFSSLRYFYCFFPHGVFWSYFKNIFLEEFLTIYFDLVFLFPNPLRSSSHYFGLANYSFVWCLPRGCLIYPMRLHWGKLLFLYQRMLFSYCVLTSEVTPCPLRCSVLRPCLAWTCAGLRHAATSFVSSYVHCPVVWKTLFPWSHPSYLAFKIFLPHLAKSSLSIERSELMNVYHLEMSSPKFLTLYVLIPICCWKKLLQCRLSEALIHGFSSMC